MDQKRKCPVCGNPTKNVIKPIHLIYPEDYLLPSDFDVVACSHCGAVYLDVEDSEKYAQFYSTYTGENTADYPVSADEDVLHNDSVCFVESHLQDRKDAQILDIGCSYGVLLGKLKARGYRNLTGMDLDVSAIEYIKRMGFQAVRGSIDEPQESFAEKFDLIILRNILEHLHNPRGAIDNVVKWLKPQGALFIEIPCVSLYYETSPYPGYFIENEHVNHFSLDTLNNLMHDFALIAYERRAAIYPLLRTIYKRDTYDRMLVKDENNKEYVSRMINCVNVQGERLNQKLEQLKGKELALWGVSRYVYRLLSHTSLKNLNIVRLVDRNPSLQGKRVMGMPIQSPDTLDQFEGTIVISGKVSQQAILADIQKRSMKNEVVCLCDDE